MRKSIGLMMVVVAALAALGAGNRPRDLITPAELYDRAERTTVEILVDGRLDGSGWFASADGLVVTAGHVIVGRTDRRIEILSPVAGRKRAKFVAIDRGHDLALLRVEKNDEPYPFLEVAGEMPAPGEDVWLFAAANFRHKLMLRGSVARRQSTYEYFSNNRQYTNVYHVSAPSPPGTSGGCWLDLRGRVVGNQSAFMTVSGAGAGIAMLSPPKAIAHFVKTRQTVPTTTTQCAFEELWTQPVGYIANYPPGSAGLVPVLIQKDGAAAKAGLSDQMIITAVDDRPVQYVDEMMTYLRGKQPGDSVAFTALKLDGSGEAQLTLTLQSLDATRN
jgi:S1-C subfamily serine protease